MSSNDRAIRDAKPSVDTSANNAVNSTAVTTPNNTAIASTNADTNTSARTSQAIGNSVDDIAITASVSAGLAKDADLSAIKIDVDTKNGAVSLTGPAPSVAARERASAIAKGTKGVVSVDNKLVVKDS